jgi:hypothetical protein
MQEKNGARSALFPFKRANIAAFCLYDRAAAAGPVPQLQLEAARSSQRALPRCVCCVDLAGQPVVGSTNCDPRLYEGRKSALRLSWPMGVLVLLEARAEVAYFIVYRHDV